MMSERQKKVLDLHTVFGLTATVTTPSAAIDGANRIRSVATPTRSGTSLKTPPPSSTHSTS
jgi:hypothetical protein